MDNCLLIAFICCSILTGSFGGPFPVPKVDWFADGKAKLQENLNRKRNTNKAKNVILFIGDGMGASTITATRVYKGQLEGKPGEEGYLSFEHFPNVAVTKTYTVDMQVPDSAATATALLSGVKTNSGTLGTNDKVKIQDCSTLRGNEVTNIVRWAQLAGKRTGIVTTTRLTHATPAAAYAHLPYREWESDLGDGEEQKKAAGCRDIGYQLVHGQTGKDINVILGGGRSNLTPPNVTDPESQAGGRRKDGRNLIQEWLDLKSNTGKTASYVWNRTELLDVNTDDTDYLLGLFSSSHIEYELSRDKVADPSMAEMVEVAINILQRDDDGFFLMVEGGRIDHGHHGGRVKRVLTDTLAMDAAVEKVLEMTEEQETLVVVTGDHSHTMTIGGGYPTRGNPILGTVDYYGASYYKPSDDKLMTTLAYANGPGGIAPGEERPNDTNAITIGDGYVFGALVRQPSETHSGEDVAVYAQGPMSHLFHGVVEQNYVAHVMAYASCVGEYTDCVKDDQKERKEKNKDCTNGAAKNSGMGIILIIVVYFIFDK